MQITDRIVESIANNAPHLSTVAFSYCLQIGKDTHRTLAKITKNQIIAMRANHKRSNFVTFKIIIKE